MDGSRFLVAVVLMIAVVVVTNIIFPPLPPPDEPPPRADTTTAAAPPPPVTPPATAPGPATPDPVASDVGADTIHVTTPLFRLAVSTRGGTIVLAELAGYESHATVGPVQLADSAGLLSHRLALADVPIDLRQFAFTPYPREGLALADGAGPDSLRLVYADSATGFGVELLYRFRPNDYVFDVHARVRGAGAATQQLLIDFGPSLPFHEWTPEEDIRALAYVVHNSQTGIESVSLSKVDTRTVENGPLLWAALKNKYFVVAALQDHESALPFGGLIAEPAGPDPAHLTATLAPNADGAFAYRFFAGPQQFERLSAVGNRFSEVNPVGWKWLRPVLQPLAKAITWILVESHRALGIGYGWLLILFGFAVRIVIWPLNARAMRSQMKNMELQPRIKEIQTKYKGDPERMNKEMMRLYKEEGFNPMGGCLPMLIPFPVLITLFFVFQATIEFRGVPFLWLPDLSRADPFYIIPILMGASMWATQWFSLRSTPDPTPQMKMMLWLMPGIMVVFFLNFASGLNLYYTAMNIASLPQQMHIVRERKRWQAQRAGAKKEVAPARG